MKALATAFAVAFEAVEKPEPILLELVAEKAIEEFETNKDFLAMDFVDSILDQVQEFMGKTSP